MVQDSLFCLLVFQFMLTFSLISSTLMGIHTIYLFSNVCLHGIALSGSADKYPPATFHIYTWISSRHPKLNMSNTELNPSSTIQISASPANLLITVDESSILLEVQTNNSSMAFSFILSNNEISYDAIEGPIRLGLSYPASSPTLTH